MCRIRKPVSILIALILAFSAVAAVPVGARSVDLAESGILYYSTGMK